ncbi:MAG: septum site-determining protein MinC, partial [Cyanobacteria bacterium REEB498]|nr:septum site-determining protein MinC [Cyanobacteria bacterium REEB498]
MQRPLHRLQLAPLAEARGSALEEVLQLLGAEPEPAPALLDCGDRPVTLPELRSIAAALEQAGLPLRRVEASEAMSLVPAAALGLETALHRGGSPMEEPAATEATAGAGLTIHRGTL